MNDDLTIIFLTPNLVPEIWAQYHKEVLIKAAQGAQFITISKKPLDWGINLIQEGYGIPNLFKQILRGAIAAKTKYIAIAEDDTLYSKEHFMLRPSAGKIGYDHSKWSLHTWGTPIYYWRKRTTNSMMIVERDLAAQILSERFERDPNSIKGEIGKYGRWRREERIEPLWAAVPNIQLYHLFGLDLVAKNKTKVRSPLEAFEIPYWGTAKNIVNKFV